MADPQVSAWFHAIDKDGSGSLNASELQAALALGNLKFGLETVDQFIRAFDTSKDRALSLEEFSRLHNFLVNVQNSFFTFDRDRSGSLSPEETQQALRQAGFTLDMPSLTSLMTKFDPDSSGTLSLDEFIRTCLMLQTAARVFGAFDARKTGSITMSFSQFVYACSHVRLG